jgi:hypothetical protein
MENRADLKKAYVVRRKALLAGRGSAEVKEMIREDLMRIKEELGLGKRKK